jgi:hypothetical protein
MDKKIEEIRDELEEQMIYLEKLDFHNLSFEEKKVIFRYMTSQSMAINRDLRTSEGKTLCEDATTLIEGLSKIPNYKERYVYRGIPLYNDYLKKDTDIQRYNNAYENQSPIIEYAFTSTSKNIQTARNFTWGNGIVFTIEHKYGKDVSKLKSYKSGEDEVLLVCNSKFNVKSIIEQGKFTHIHLVEIEK